jgi:ribonuclease HI
MSLPPSVLVYFDASVLYAADNATPTSAAIGYHVDAGTETRVAGSESVDTFVSSTDLEYRALLEAVQAVTDRFSDLSSLHVHGDADVVIRTVDPDHPARAKSRIARRRVATIRERVADVPVVTYRAVPRGHNERAHDLARAGHER